MDPKLGVTNTMKLQDYLGVRNHVHSFQQQLRDQLDRFEEGAKGDLVKKQSSLIAFDFEAAVRLKAWDDLQVIIDNASVCASPGMYETMADCILSSEAPTSTTVSCVKV